MKFYSISIEQDGKVLTSPSLPDIEQRFAGKYNPVWAVEIVIAKDKESAGMCVIGAGRLPAKDMEIIKDAFRAAVVAAD
jgi:hypothetical protein